MDSGSQLWFGLGTFSSEGGPSFPGLVLFGERVVAVDSLRTLCASLGQPLPDASSTLALFENWSQALPALQAATESIARADSVAARTLSVQALPLSSLRVHSPVASRQVFMSGANYFKHVVDLIVDLGPGKTPGTEGMDAAQLRAHAQALMTRRRAEGSPTSSASRCRR